MKLEIFEHTNGGEKVFDHYIPNLPANLRKKFKIREDEKTASASIVEKQGVWIFKDFGSTNKAMNAIDFVMEANALTYLNACIKIIQDMSLPIDIDGKTLYEYKNPVFPDMQEIPDKVVSGIWETRGISEPIVKRFGLFMQKKFITQANSELDCVVFPFYEDGVIVNAKNRSKYEPQKGVTKKIYQLEKNGKRVFYNIDSITSTTQLGIIVEGEFDVLAVEQALLYLYNYTKKTPNNTLNAKKIGVISVSNGAGSLSDNLTLCGDKIRHIKEWIVFVDDDKNGKALEDEFVRRIGRNKCRIAKKYGFKDANDLLIGKGEDMVLQALDNASYSKIEGLVEFKNYEHQLDYLYYNGLPEGLRLGYLNEGGFGFDNYFSMHTKTLNILTGIPSTGKSTFIDTISCLMAKKYGWKTAYFTPEYPDIPMHVSQLINTLTSYRFRKNKDEVSDEIINECDYFEAKDFIKKHFYHFESPVDDRNRMVEVTTNLIYNFMEDVVSRYGVKHIVLDPLNKIGNSEKFIGGGLVQFMNRFFNELTYIKKYLDVAITVIAHPTKLLKTERFDYVDSDGINKKINWYPVVTGYDVFGGSEIYNQVDGILSIYRVPPIIEGNGLYPVGYSQLYVQKMRFNYLGRQGVSEFQFDAKKRQFNCIDTEHNVYNINPLQEQQPQEFYDEPPF